MIYVRVNEAGHTEEYQKEEGNERRLKSEKEKKRKGKAK